MILNIAIFYQIVFNTLNFCIIMPFILNDNEFIVSLLYLSATIPSFLLTVPLNNLFQQKSLKYSISFSMLCSIICLLFLLVSKEFLVLIISLILRSSFGVLFVPKISQYVGSLKMPEKRKSLFGIQILMFSPGILGYILALILSDINFIYVAICMESLLFISIIFLLPANCSVNKKEIMGSFCNKSLFKESILYFETIIITAITYISLFVVNDILIVFKGMETNQIIFSIIMQLFISIFIVKYRALFTNKIIFILISLFLISSFVSIFIFNYLFVCITIFIVLFFTKSQHFWYSKIAYHEQSYFFAKRLVIINTPKFFICTIPLFIF